MSLKRIFLQRPKIGLLARSSKPQRCVAKVTLKQAEKGDGRAIVRTWSPCCQRLLPPQPTESRAFSALPGRGHRPSPQRFSVVFHSLQGSLRSLLRSPGSRANLCRIAQSLLVSMWLDSVTFMGFQPCLGPVLFAACPRCLSPSSVWPLFGAASQGSRGSLARPPLLCVPPPRDLLRCTHHFGQNASASLSAVSRLNS